MEQELLVNAEEKESSEALKEQESLEKPEGRKLSFRRDVLLQIIVTIFGVLLANIGTKVYDDIQDKERLISQLESAININQMTIEIVEVRMRDAKKYIEAYSKNSYGDDVAVKEFSIYEPISYFDYSDSLFKDPILYKKLTKKSQVNLPEISANIQTILSYYDTEKNDYYNYLALKHLKNNLTWQKYQLQYEFDYQIKKQSKINLSIIKSKYENNYDNIEKEWRNYTKMYRAKMN
jgi:hypothetical protein